MRLTRLLPMMPAILLAASIRAQSGISSSAGEPQNFLPDSIPALGAVRSAEILIFPADSLHHCTNNADFFRQFNVIDLATTEYSVGDTVVVVELYRFPTPEDAFGLYSHLRWGNAQNMVPVGIEGFGQPIEITFVKGNYVADITGFDDSERPAAMRREFAESLDSALPGNSDLPAGFALFPAEGIVPGTTLYFARAFLGLNFADKVYACNYAIGADTVFLFAAAEGCTEILNRWKERNANDSTMMPPPAGIPYDDGRGFMFTRPRMGQFIVGIKNGVLAGEIGYRDSHNDFLTAWLNSLPDTGSTEQ
jgi:hypothetical protein